jgi:hypothetical protein
MFLRLVFVVSIRRKEWQGLLYDLAPLKNAFVRVARDQNPAISISTADSVAKVNQRAQTRGKGLTFFIKTHQDLKKPNTARKPLLALTKHIFTPHESAPNGHEHSLPYPAKNSRTLLMVLGFLL